MLTSFDDYPIHQACVAVAHTATADLNHYDRYFFNGYTPNGDLYFALAMGLYPNRHVHDAAFSVVRNGQQISVFASARAPHDRRDANRVGPIEVDVVEPLQVLSVRVDAPEHGVTAELTFTAVSSPIEEPHYFQRVGTRVMMDYTRLTQFGRWSGWLDVDGERVDVEELLGSRDRSWGVRPIGEPAPSGAPVGLPQFFWIWAPVCFDGFSTHFDVNEFGDGRRWHDVGASVEHGAEADMMRAVDWRVRWHPGTRYADAFEYDLLDWNGGVTTVVLEPLYNFQMSGIGYGHPRWTHGAWRGECEVGGERVDLPVADPLTRESVHVQTVCKATCTRPDGSTHHGTGILELLCIGPHPTGLTGVLDPYDPG